jgi:protein-export membrane protein SecD
MRRMVIGLIVVLAIAWGSLAGLLANDITPRLGLDLQGGTSVVLTAPEGTDPDLIEVATQIMNSRISSIGGVQEPEIAISGGNTVLVQLPGVQNEQQALDAVGTTGVLSFRPVLALYNGSAGPYGSAFDPTPGIDGDEIEPPVDPADRPDNIDPVTGLTIDDDPSQPSFLQYQDSFFGVDQTVVLELGPAELLGTDVSQALPQFNGAQWAVSLDLTGEGGDKFAELTGEAALYNDARRRIAIVLDGEVLTAPEVNQDIGPEGITGGRAQITVGTSPDAEEEAQQLSVVLRYGSLPVAFERSQVSKVSATLGSDSLQIGLTAGVAGLALVVVSLLLYYRALGLVALIGLSVFGSLLVVIYSALGELRGLTLTLAGVTGIVVSIGITADSYIVYFERIKEDIRAGLTVHSAVTEGFRSAYRTILTADTVSLLGAILLYILAVGPVRGFALTLGIATVLDLFVARAFTRRAAWILSRTRFAEGGFFSITAAAGEHHRLEEAPA